jgi:ribose 5-phosphate isomerase RpiB
MIVAIGNDHAGYPLKPFIVSLLKELGIQTNNLFVRGVFKS